MATHKFLRGYISQNSNDKLSQNSDGYISQNSDNGLRQNSNDKLSQNSDESNYNEKIFYIYDSNTKKNIVLTIKIG